MASILGARHESVRSSHHQGVGQVGAGLVESAWAEDGSLEGLEDPSKRFAVGVLWHPEMEDDDKRLFEALVAEARAYRAERGPPGRVAGSGVRPRRAPPPPGAARPPAPAPLGDGSIDGGVAMTAHGARGGREGGGGGRRPGLR